MKFILGLITAVVVLVGGAAVWIYSGWYNVAALDHHGPLTTWALHTTMARSVTSRAADIIAPADLASRATRGFEDFDAMCVGCHGAPGQERGEIGKGLTPNPPALTVAAQRWSAAELFWIVKNGVRMTGMPAFGPTHSDDRLWDIVAFAQQLPSLSAAQYSELKEKSGQAGASHNHSAHDHGGHDHSGHDQSAPAQVESDPPKHEHEHGHDHADEKH